MNNMITNETFDLTEALTGLDIFAKKPGKKNEWEELVTLGDESFVPNKVLLRIFLDYEIKSSLLDVKRPVADLVLPPALMIQGFCSGRTYDEEGKEIGTFNLLPDGLFSLFFDPDVVKERGYLYGNVGFEVYLACSPSSDSRSVTLAFSNRAFVAFQIEPTSGKLTFDPRMEIRAVTAGERDKGIQAELFSANPYALEE